MYVPVALKDVDSSLFKVYGASDIHELVKFVAFWQLDMYELQWVNGTPLAWCWK